jgi:hypothetical protein
MSKESTGKRIRVTSNLSTDANESALPIHTNIQERKRSAAGLRLTRIIVGAAPIAFTATEIGSEMKDPKESRQLNHPTTAPERQKISK